jgi:hypothetical protein
MTNLINLFYVLGDQLGVAIIFSILDTFASNFSQAIAPRSTGFQGFPQARGRLHTTSIRTDPNIP